MAAARLRKRPSRWPKRNWTITRQASRSYPASLIIEGFAQTGGLLVGEHRGFRERTVLAKVGKAKFHFEVRPGDMIRFEVTVEDLQSDGAIVRGAATVAGQLQAEVEIMFAFLDQRFEGVELFRPADFLAILRLLGVYDVGRKPDGTPLEVPPHLLEAEGPRTMVVSNGRVCGAWGRSPRWMSLARAKPRYECSEGGEDA